MESAQPSVCLLFQPAAGSTLDLPALAEVLAASELWAGSVATLIVRPPPHPLLAVVGFFDPVVERRIEALSFQLRQAEMGTRYVSYAQAEADSEVLADKLKAAWGVDALRQFDYLPVPRGGLIVLAMLAYVLDLPPEACRGAERSDVPLVVVDDCALSGARFRSVLAEHPGRAVIFAHLYSSPALRAAVEAAEPGVVSCIAAHDLDDRSPDAFGAVRAEWQDRWRERRPGAYWTGLTEPLSFAWNEPDFAIWNEALGAAERGWSLVPGRQCLKNRPGGNGAGVAVELQPVGKGPLGPGPDVVFGRLAGRLIIGRAAAADAVSLDGVAADMWAAIVSEGRLDAAADSLTSLYEVAPDVLRADLEALAGALMETGYLTGEG